ncbi:head maturation protease, ClpP-related [Enterococcus sp. H57]|uniref:head maturation protease, ClpP-related n=1 Tax=Enterococcus sp. H57 TaxID=2035004 RepID=UPI000D59A647|nr:head maturation protease, ClpP-related [Enterococcus sp. H57]
MKKFWECKQSANQNEADVFIFGEIVSFKWDDTDTTAASFQKDLKELGEVSQINLHINSPGGSVFEGIAIGNMLRQHKARVVAHVDALAASIASVIVASCDEVIMPENSMLMIHNPWTISMGNAKALRKQADDLDKIAESSVVTYLAKAGEKLTEEKIKQIMDEETWMSAQEAYNYGLCDVVESANQVAASISQKLFETYQKVPEKLLDSRQEDSRDQEKIEKIVKHAKQNKALIGTILGGL